VKLAVLDWGIGGLGVFRLLAERHPAVPVVYLSDAGFTPYGKVPRRALAARVDHLLRRLAREHGATHALLACNAASTVLRDLAAPRDGLPVCGIIQPALAELARRPRARMGVIGGRRTVQSGIYGRALRAAGHEVRQRVAQPLSAHVEAGRLATPCVRADVAAILAPLRHVDVLVMACTHYPALSPLLREHCPHAELYDPASAAVRHLAREWPLPATRTTSTHRFLTTGDPAAMQNAARLAFGLHLPHVDLIAS
jgi:glutamate racemase